MVKSTMVVYMATITIMEMGMDILTETGMRTGVEIMLLQKDQTNLQAAVMTGHSYSLLSKSDIMKIFTPKRDSERDSNTTNIHCWSYRTSSSFV